MDFKTFGFLRGTRHKETRRLGGFVAVDCLTAYADVHLADTPDAKEACKALAHYVDNAPFQPKGILLTDNGGCFISAEFIAEAAKAGFIQRTIRPGHPWSNGKVEALNKTLKYQCFPVIAGNITDWDQAVDLVGTWMDYYNKSRAHGGHINRGLPPLAFLDLYKKTPGSHVEKLLNLGLIKLDDEWSIRMMGDTRQVFGKRPDGAPRDQGLNLDDKGQPLPFALVLDRTPRAGFSQDFSDKGHKLDRPPDQEPTNGGMVLYK